VPGGTMAGSRNSCWIARKRPRDSVSRGLGRSALSSGNWRISIWVSCLSRLAFRTFPPSTTHRPRNVSGSACNDWKDTSREMRPSISEETSCEPAQPVSNSSETGPIHGIFRSRSAAVLSHVLEGGQGLRDTWLGWLGNAALRPFLVGVVRLALR